MRARVARPRGHRPGRGGACLARAHAVASAGAGGVQPALVVDAGRRRRRSAPSTRSAGSCAARTRSGCCRRPRPLRWSAPRPTTGSCSAAGALEESIRADAARPRDAGGPGHARAPGRVLLRRVRRPRLAADLLRRPRRARRRHPQGGLRPRAAAGRRRPALPPGLLPPAHRRLAAGSTSTGSTTDPERLPAALVTGDDGEPLTVTVPVGAEQVVAQVWRVDVGRVPLFLLDADRPENGAVARWITLAPVHRRRATLRLAQYLLLGVGGVRALRGDGDRARRRAPQRGPRRVRLARAGARRAGGRRARSTTRWPRPARAPSSPRTRRCRRATTPTRPSQVARALAHARRRGSASTLDDDRPPRPHAPRRRRRAVRRHAVRAAHEPRAPTASAAATARSRARCGTRCGPTAPSTTCRSATSPTACTSRPGSATRCATLLDRHLGEGWLDRAADPATWDAGRRRSRRRRAVGRAQRAARRARSSCVRASAAWSTASAATSRASYVEAAASVRPRRADDRLRPPPGHLQAAAPAAARRRARDRRLLVAATARSRSCSPARRTRATTTASALVQALFAAKGTREVGRRVAYLDDYDLAHRRARSSRGCDVWVNLPAPAAGGERHERA